MTRGVGIGKAYFAALRRRVPMSSVVGVGGVPPQPSTVSKRLALLPTTLLLALRAVSATPCRDRCAERSAATRAPVEVFRPERREAPRSIRATGTLFGDDETTLAAARSLGV
jgi:hypothetical protein